MAANQIELLSILAEKIKAEKKDRSKVVMSLQSAKILTKNENLTSYYSNLKKVVIVNK
jgi:hypothetical protein